MVTTKISYSLRERHSADYMLVPLGKKLYFKIIFKNTEAYITPLQEEKFKFAAAWRNLLFIKNCGVESFAILKGFFNPPLFADQIIEKM